MKDDHELEYLRLCFQRSAGAVCDAGDIVVPDLPSQLELSVRDLVRERNLLREQLAELWEQYQDACCYVDPYFRKKWNHEGTLEKFTEIFRLAMAKKP